MPGDPDAPVQLDVVLEQPVQAYEVGLPVQVALIVIDVPATGNPLLAASVHAGRPAGSMTGEHITTGIAGGP